MTTEVGPDRAAAGSIPARIGAGWRAHPDRVAVVESSSGRSATYDELWAASGRVAGSLQRHGIEVGHTVALSLEMGVEATAVMLGLLRAGVATAPMDPRWPPARRELILDRLAPAAHIGTGGGARDLAVAVLHDGSRSDGWVAVDPASTATVFFTSGTSGEPKLVASPHHALTRLVGPGRTLFTRPGAVMLQSCRPGWDVLSLELWAPLCAGGTSHVLQGGLLPDTLAGAIAEGVTHAWVTSSLLNLMVDEDVDCVRGLEQLLTGGEVLSPPHVAALRRRHPDLQLVNGYGPVETCVFATTHAITEPPQAQVPIGRPVSDTVVRLVDASDPGNRMVDEGEIWIGGLGLANGYVGDQALTADRFVEVKEEDGTTGRYYRSGDRALRDGDGVLHFVGRVDRQVKIRGARVQPEELEVVAGTLLDHSCRALPVPGRWSGYDRLALFVSDPLVAPAELRRSLAARLPKHLVPDVIRVVKCLPVTINGKVDDRALLASLVPAPVPAATAGV